jgi:hypothetical protein
MEKVLVLNDDYTPLKITTVFEGFNLVNRGKAEIDYLKEIISNVDIVVVKKI